MIVETLLFPLLCKCGVYNNMREKRLAVFWNSNIQYVEYAFIHAYKLEISSYVKRVHKYLLVHQNQYRLITLQKH